MSAYVTLTAVPLDGTSIFPILSYGMSDGSFIPDDAIEIDTDISLDLSAYAVDMSTNTPSLIAMPREIRQQIVDISMANEVRAKRNTLIAATDYLLSEDYPIDAAKLDAVKKYRKALRDITEQANFPSDIVWPEMPD